MSDWDESRNAENSLEILKSHDWITTKYGGAPDLWNLKPPLGAWLTSISFLIFGVNEFSVRFFSALAGVGTVLLVFLFGKELKNNATGFVASLILLTIIDFVGYHGARTGDYDALLTFFIVFSFYLYYLYEKKQKLIFLIFSGACISAAFLIKDFVGLFPIAIIFIYVIYNYSFKNLFRKDWIYFLATIILISLPWLTLRFLAGYKFFMEMFSYDIINRSLHAIEGHAGDVWYYFNIIKLNFYYPLLFYIVISILYFFYASIKKRKEYSLISIWVLFFFIIFSIAETKISWYIIPIYPALCIMTAIFLNDAGDYLEAKNLTFILFTLLILFYPIKEIIGYVNLSETNDAEYVYRISTQNSLTADAFKDEIKNCNNLYLYSEDNRQQALLFYLSRDIKGYVHFYKDTQSISSNKKDFLITSDEIFLKTFKNNGNKIKLVDQYNNLYLYQFF
jgi:4-amino-4-deoxy-L-arabinose transferase-like glycosyltransferase